MRCKVTLLAAALTLSMAIQSASAHQSETSQDWWTEPSTCKDINEGKPLARPQKSQKHHFFKKRRNGEIGHFYDMVWPSTEVDEWTTECNALIKPALKPLDEPCWFNPDIFDGAAVRLAIRQTAQQGVYEGVVLAANGSVKYALGLSAVSPTDTTVSGWLVGTSPALPDHVFYIFMRDMDNAGKGKYYQIEVYNLHDSMCLQNRPRPELVCRQAASCAYKPGQPLIGSIVEAGTGGGYEPPP